MPLTVRQLKCLALPLSGCSLGRRRAPPTRSKQSRLTLRAGRGGPHSGAVPVTEATGYLKRQDFLTRYGLLLSARTPAAVSQAVEKAAATVLAWPGIRERMAALATNIQATPTARFAERMRAETA